MSKHSSQSIATFTGKFIEPLNPSWDDIDIVDIAHGLSQICRYGGQSNKPYNVAQHSVYVSYNCHPSNALNGLLHDGSEAYLGDIPRPMKHTPSFAAYREAEAVLQDMIFRKYGVWGIEMESYDIKQADSLVLSLEQSFLFSNPWRETQDIVLRYEGEDLFDVFRPWSSRVSEERFLQRFRELKGETKC